MMLSVPTPSVQFAFDGPGALDAGDDGLYLRWDNATSKFVVAAGAGGSDHGGLSGLSDDDHAQYALLAGRSGGQSLVGGTAANDDLTLGGTSHATRTTSYVLLQPSGGNVGIGTSTPSELLHLVLNQNGNTSIRLQNSTGGTAANTRFMMVNNAGSVGQFGIYSTATTAYGAILSGQAYFYADVKLNIMSDLNGGAIQMSVGSAPSTAAVIVSAVTPNVLITALGAAHVPFTVKGAAAQTANLQEWQNSSGTVLGSRDSAGRSLVPLGALATCGLAFTGDVNTGLYSAGADAVSMVSGGTDRFQVNATGIGFFAATPVAKAAHIADPSGGGTQDAEARTAINAILVALENYGLLATS